MKTITADKLLSSSVISIAPKAGANNHRSLVALIDDSSFLVGEYTLLVLIPIASSVFRQRYIVDSEQRFTDAAGMAEAADEFYHLTEQKLPNYQLQRISENLPL